MIWMGLFGWFGSELGMDAPRAGYLGAGQLAKVAQGIGCGLAIWTPSTHRPCPSEAGSRSRSPSVSWPTRCSARSARVCIRTWSGIVVELAPPASFPPAGRQVAQGLNGEARRQSPGFSGCVCISWNTTLRYPTSPGLGSFSPSTLGAMAEALRKRTESQRGKVTLCRPVSFH